MRKKPDTGRDPDNKELREAERVLNLHPVQQETHPSTVKSDTSKLNHTNTYGSVPEYYIDRPFICRLCGKHEVWKAKDQKWYYEETKGHIGAVAVECHDCRKQKKKAANKK